MQLLLPATHEHAPLDLHTLHSLLERPVLPAVHPCPLGCAHSLAVSFCVLQRWPTIRVNPNAFSELIIPAHDIMYFRVCKS